MRFALLLMWRGGDLIQGKINQENVGQDILAALWHRIRNEVPPCHRLSAAFASQWR